MANGEAKPGEALADKWRERFEKDRREEELALTRLDVRADMKSMGEDEISEVIDQRALERHKKDSDAPPSGHSKIAISLVKAVKGWPQALVALGIIALVAFWLWLRK